MVPGFGSPQYIPTDSLGRRKRILTEVIRIVAVELIGVQGVVTIVPVRERTIKGDIVPGKGMLPLLDSALIGIVVRIVQPNEPAGESQTGVGNGSDLLQRLSRSGV